MLYFNTFCFLALIFFFTAWKQPGTIPQVFLASLPPVAGQIPVSAVQLHPVWWTISLQQQKLWCYRTWWLMFCGWQMVISQQSSSNSLTELQVVSLDVHQSKDDWLSHDPNIELDVHQLDGDWPSNVILTIIMWKVTVRRSEEILWSFRL